MAITIQGLMSSKDVAEYLNIPQATLAQWRHKGTGPRWFKVGKHVRYKLNDVDLWLIQHSSNAD